MENLNAEQIKKVLLHCANWTFEKGCKGCPYDGNCIDEDVMKDALSLITSQEQRIKELEVENVQFRHEQEKLIEECDVYKTWAYNKNALTNSMTDKIESGYEPSAARACAEAEMWQRIALREKELTEENEGLRSIIAEAKENATEHVKMLKEIKSAAKKFKNNILLTLFAELNAEFLKVARCQKADEPNMRSQEVFDILDRKIKEMLEDV